MRAAQKVGDHLAQATGEGAGDSRLKERLGQTTPTKRALKFCGRRLFWVGMKAANPQGRKCPVSWRFAQVLREFLCLLNTQSPC